MACVNIGLNCRIESDESIQIDFLMWIESNLMEIIFGELECTADIPATICK